MSAVNCQVYTWQNSKLIAAGSFIDNTEGHEQFATFLQIHRDPAFLLTDLVEEDFRQETIPHLHGGERTALIQRKLEQYYRKTPFRQAITLQRSKDGRRDDDMLFSALTNPAIVTPWLNIMLDHSIPLAGIYSIPNISGSLVQEIPFECLLLLSWEKYAGLRQTFFDKKMLRFSRLSPLNDSDSFGATAATEATRTQQYLKNLSLLPSGQTLNVSIICHANDRPELAKHLIDDGDIQYAYLDIQELVRHTGSTTIYPDSDATQLFLRLLAIKPPSSHYASAEHIHLLKVLKLRRSLWWLSAAFMAASVVWTASNIRDAGVQVEEGMALKVQAGLVSQQTQKIIENFQGPLATATDMKTAVILSRKLNSFPPTPQDMLDGLSKTLDEFTTVRTDKLSWQTDSGKESIPIAQASAIAVSPATIILLSGELSDFTGGYRAELDYVERFRQALIRRGYSVTALALPLDISPQGSIAADTGDGSNKSAQFSLKLLWRGGT
ncbi:MAG: hypothetical protein WDM70_09085 [Nitrosomonadales bacterium]